MSFSNDWDERYKEGSHHSIWPWSELISYVMQYARPQRPNFKVLEVGCGAGANIPFFNSLGVEYYAIEGSPYIVDMLKKKFHNENIVCGDFSVELPFELEFDLIVDRSALTHNSTDAIRKSLNLIYKKLKSGGKFIGTNWFSTDHSEYKMGEEAEDRYTKSNYKRGPFATVGKVHFSNKKLMLELLKDFNIIILVKRFAIREIPQDGAYSAVWDFVCEKNTSD